MGNSGALSQGGNANAIGLGVARGQLHPALCDALQESKRCRAAKDSEKLPFSQTGLMGIGQDVALADVKQHRPGRPLADKVAYFQTNANTFETKNCSNKPRTP